MPKPLHRSTTASPAGAARADRVDVLLRILYAVRHPRRGTEALGPRRIAIHFLRCAAHLATFRDWYGNPSNPALRRELDARPQLVTCVVHPYLNTAWTARRKLTVIGAHYGMLEGHLAMLGQDAPVLLADAADDLQIRLERPGKFEHEGEATIHLRRGDEDLYALAFTLGQHGTHRVAYVGALQGLNSADALEIYRGLTHRLHGLRPRDLVVSAFRHLCQALGVTRILAVGDARRVSSNAYFTSSSRVLSSYDTAWSECGGVASDDGFFELSPGMLRRDADAVPARKRALYRRRYEMLDRLAQQIDAAVLDGAARPVAV